MQNYLLLVVTVFVLASCGGEGTTVTRSFPKETVTPDDIVEPIFGAASGSADTVGRWGEVMQWPHVPVSMSHLPDGRLLTYSGSERRTWPTTEQTYSATWDPATGLFEEDLFRGHNMFCGALTLNSEGGVFVNGGRNGGNSPWTSIFDHTTDTWSAQPNMASGGRWYPTTLSLADNSVLTAMGSATNVRNPDLWSPNNGWEVLNGVDFLTMRTGRGGSTWFPQLSQAPNGSIFHYWDPQISHFIDTDGNGSAGNAEAISDGGSHPPGIQLMYDVGKLLMTGSNDGSWSGSPKSSAFTIDLNGAAPRIAATADMTHPRAFHQLIPLPTGEVLVVGGNTTGAKFRDSGSVMEPEIWNPQTGQWRGMANMAVPRDYHSTALLLPDGRVIAAGGGYDAGNPNSSGTHQDAQLFSPPYLFNGDDPAPRPALSARADSVEVGSSFQVETTGNVQSFSFIRMGGTTHAVNTDSRFYRPEFVSQGNGVFDITVHENPNVAIPGYWMLFGLDSSNVPSEALIIKVTSDETRAVNVALGGTATQSSTFADIFTADKGNDGDANGVASAGKMTHTVSEPQPWWHLDLGKRARIDSVRLWNRTDCCADRLRDVYVLVSAQPFTSNDLQTTLAQQGVESFRFDGIAGRTTDFEVNTTGRYLRVQLAGTGFLQLAEVEVFGETEKPIKYQYYEGEWSNLPDFEQLTPVATGRTDSISVSRRQRNERYALRLSSAFVAATTGSYTFSTTSDDGSQLFVDGQLVVDNDGLHGAQRRTGTVELAAGQHDLVVTFFERTGADSLSATWQGPGFSERSLDGDLLTVVTPLEVMPLTSTPQQQSNNVIYTASASGDEPLQYSWNFGDGTPSTDFTADASASHTYTASGRYVVSVTVKDRFGDERREVFTQIIHGVLTPVQPVSSGSILEISARQQLWNANPDNNTVTVTNTDSLTAMAEISVGEEPVALTLGPDNRVWVVNRDSATISVIDPQSLTLATTFVLPAATQPWGIVVHNNTAIVALEATGELYKLASDGAEISRVEVGNHPRHLTVDPAQDKLYVSRFITAPLPGEDTGNPIVDDGVRPYGGEVLVLTASSLAVEDTIILEHSNRTPSENQGPGIPNYLGAAAVSPIGGTAWVPSKQDNILSGDVRGGTELSFDQTVRAVTSLIDLNLNLETTDSRVDHDNASVAHSAVFDPYGATLFVSLEGNRQVALVDTSTAVEIARFDTRFAPQSMLVSDDGNRLYVHNYMDRSIGVYDITAVVNRGDTSVGEIATVSVVSNEALDSIVLRGKQLFHDARDDRLAGLDYMSCASCHVDGEHDGRVWDFTALGEGLRNTITLKGRSGMGHGMLHWTGNFDELQDFEGQIREFALGAGLMNDADFAATTDPLGAPKAGLSEDLDALAAYMSSLDAVPDSPWRAADGGLTADAEVGQSLFTSLGCAACHTGETFTDSVAAVLHDIGSIMPDSGFRLGQALPGFDTPTLLGVWRTAPYLHDGSAATLQDAISAHLDLTLTTEQLDSLAAYLLQLDNRSGPPVVPPVDPPPLVLSNQVSEGAITVDGSISDWVDLEPYADDPAELDSSNPIDWLSAAVAHDSTRYYITYTADEEVQDRWGYAIFIDTDGDRSTGFTGFLDEYPIGADYLIESYVVQRYTGQTNNEWSWEFVGAADRVSSGNTAEIAVDMAMLGNASDLQFFFRGDNSAVEGTEVDFYPDAANDPSADQRDRILEYSASFGGNVPPIANDQSLVVSENSTLTLTLTGSDVNGDNLTFQVADLPTNGVLTGVAPQLTYTPETDFIGTDSFTFTANDGEANSSIATVAVVVQGSAPSNNRTIVVDGNLADWDSADSFGLDAADANSFNDQIDWQRGWLAHDADNLYVAYTTYDPVITSWGYSLYMDTDGDRSTGFQGFLDDYPIGADYVLEQNTLLKYTGSGRNWSWADEGLVPMQIDGNNAEIAVPLTQTFNPRALRLFFFGINAAVDGTTPDYYPDGAISPISQLRYFDYTIDTQGLNRAPTSAGQLVQTNINTSLALQLIGSDPDGDSLTYLVTRSPSNGSLTGNGANRTYTPENGFTGTDTFSYTVSDGELSSQEAIISIAVTSGEQNSPSYSVNNPNANIVVDGSLTDWSNMSSFVLDPAEQGDIDLQQIWVADNTANIYIALQQYEPMSDLVWGHQIYIDTDSDSSTGFRGFASEYPLGANYVIEGSDLFRYDGEGTDWNWIYVGSLAYAVSGNAAELILPVSDIGNPASFDFLLRADGTALEGGTTLDRYPDGFDDLNVNLRQRRFTYTINQ